MYAPQVGVPDSRARDVLHLVGLDDAADRQVGGFSLGMRQRLALATTLLGDPPVLLLDELANGLDPEGISWLRGFLRALAAQGRTVLVSSHVLSEAQQTVDDVVIINHGRLVRASSLAGLAAGRRPASGVRRDPAPAGGPTTVELLDVGYMAFIAVILAWALTESAATSSGSNVPADLSTEAIVRSASTVTVSLGYVFPLLVGTLLVTAEYRHRTITPTLLAEPDRDRVVAAKLLVGAGLGLVFGLLGTAASTAPGASVLALLHKPTGLQVGSTWRTLGLSVLALGVWALLGVAFGTVLTNQVAVILLALAFTQFVEPVLRTVLGLSSWGKGIGLPGAAGEAVTGGSIYSAGGLAGPKAGRS